MFVWCNDHILPKKWRLSLILRSQSWSVVSDQICFTFFFLGSIVKAFKVCLVVSNRKLMIMLAINGANSHLLWFSACVDSYWHDNWASGRDVRSAESLQHFLQWWQCWACGHPVLWMEEAHCSGVFAFYPFLHSLLCISTKKMFVIQITLIPTCSVRFLINQSVNLSRHTL